MAHVGGFRVFVPNRSAEGDVQWLISPASHIDPAALDWYIDASLVDGTLGPCARYGAAGIAVDQRGHLVAAWKGVPPAHVDSIGEAEAWALATVLLETPCRRRVYTDCKANLDFLAAGPTAATAGNMRGARIWSTIFAALDREDASDADTDIQESNDWLVWLPAHKAKHSIGKCYKSDGQPLSCIDWLANTAADRLAKEAADGVRASELTRTQFLWAKEAAAHWRMALGRITFLANNHVVTGFDEEGEEVQSVTRDSDGRPTTSAAKKDINPVDEASNQDLPTEIWQVFDSPDFFLHNLPSAPFAAQGPIVVNQEPAVCATASESCHPTQSSREYAMTQAIASLNTSSMRRARREDSRASVQVTASVSSRRRPTEQLSRLPPPCRAPASSRKKCKTAQPTEPLIAYCPSALTDADRDRRSAIASSLIAAATEMSSVATPAEACPQQHHAPLPPPRRPANAPAELTPTGCRGSKSNLEGRFRPLSPPTAHVERKRGRPPILPPKQSALTGACARLAYGYNCDRTGRPPDARATAARR